MKYVLKQTYHFSLTKSSLSISIINPITANGLKALFPEAHEYKENSSTNPKVYYSMAAVLYIKAMSCIGSVTINTLLETIQGEDTAVKLLALCDGLLRHHAKNLNC